VDCWKARVENSRFICIWYIYTNWSVFLLVLLTLTLNTLTLLVLYAKMNC